MRKIMLLLTSVLLTLVTSIAFSALSTSLAITSEVRFRFIADIRINSVSFVSASGGAQLGYESDFSKNTVSNGFTLPSVGSSITYRVHVDNAGDVDYSIYNILRQSSDNGLNVSVSGYNVQDVIPAKTSVDLILTYTTTNPSESVINVVETFDYRKVYHVTYETGTNQVIPAQVKYEGVNLTLTNQEPTKTGYTFTKWNTESDGTGTNYNAGSTYALDEDATLYARYTANIYNINYTMNSGPNPLLKPLTGTYDEDVVITNPADKTVTITGNANNTNATIGNPTSNTQVFTGWTSSTLGNNAKSGTTANPSVAWNGTSTTNTYFRNLVDSGTVTLEANWNGNGVLPTLTKRGNECKWYDAATNGNELGSGGDPIVLNSNSPANVTVYAECVVTAFKVEYDTEENGGTGTIPEDYVPFGEPVDLTPTATKTGWTFVGWNTDKDATTALSSLTMGIDDITLYAIYRKEAVPLTANWHGNGATLSSNDPSTCNIPAVYNKAVQGTSCEVSAPTVTKEGYDLIGWNQVSSAITNDSNYDISTNKLTITVNTTGHTWYAITRAGLPLTATFEANNGATVSPATATCYLYGASESCQVEAPTVTAQTGFNHIGFSMNQNATSNSSSYNTTTNKLTITGDSTWYPITKSASQYTGTFVIQDPDAATQSGGNTSCYRYNGNESCNITAPTLTAKTGYEVVGWDKNQTGETAAYASGAQISIDNNTIFYSKTYYKTVVTITFNRNITNAKVISLTPSGGTASTETTLPLTCNKYNGGTTCNIISPSMEVLTGYHAIGYATSASATTSSWNENTLKTVTTDATYYAITQGNTYTIRFNANCPTGITATGTMSNMTMAYGTSRNLTANAFGCAGRVFDGWTLNAAGTGEAFADEESVSNLTTTAGDIVDLYGRWRLTPPSPTISGGKTKVYGSSTTTLTCTENTTYPSGVVKYYSFGYATQENGTPSGWSDTSTSNTRTISSDAFIGERWYSCRVYASDGVEISNTEVSSNTTKMTLKNAKITFNAGNCGTISGTSPGYVNNTMTGVYTGATNTTAGTIPTASKSGYTFAGWYEPAGISSRDLTYSIQSLGTNNEKRRINFANAQSASNNWAMTSADVGIHISGKFILTDSTVTTQPTLDFNDITITPTNVTRIGNDWIIYVDFDITLEMVSARTYGYDINYRFIDIEGVTSSSTVTVEYLSKRSTDINLLNTNVSESTPSDTAFANTTARTFTPNTIVKGLAYDNYYNPSAVSSYSVGNNSITYTASSGYGIGFPLLSNPNQNYTLSYNASSSGTANIGVLYYKSDGTLIDYIRNKGNGDRTIAFTTPANTYYLVITFDAEGSNTTINVTDIKLEREFKLPSGYTQVEYIQSYGQQNIDTGYKATPTTGVEIDYQYSYLTLQQRLFGSETSDSNYLTYEMYINGLSNWAYAFQDGAGNWVNTGVAADTNRHIIKFNTTSGKVIIDNTTLDIASSTRTKTTASNVFIMSHQIAGKSAMKLYSFKIYDNGTLVRNFVPCIKDSTGEVGLYDLVGNTFYGNSGTGQFIAGGNTKVIAADKTIQASVPNWTDANKKWLLMEDRTLVANCVDGTAPTITAATASTTLDYRSYIDFTATDADSGVVGYNVTTSATAPTTWIPVVSTVEAATETKYENGAAWARVFHHNNHWGNVYFTNADDAKSSNTVDKYSVLGSIANYKNSSNWELMLQYPQASTTQYNRWTQTDNPVTTSIANTSTGTKVGGYTAVHIDWTSSRWGGMAASSNANTLLDGDTGHGNWFYAIGVYNAFQGGMPGPGTVDSIVNFWARIDNLSNIASASVTRRIGDISSNGTYYVWVKDYEGNTAYTTVSVSNIDTTAPSGSITSTNNVATSQTATLSMSDNKGVTMYYWGTTNPASNNVTYTSITSTTSTSVTKTVSDGGTYYLALLDAAGNRTIVSKVFYKTTLNANGGSVSPASVVTMAGNNFTIPSPSRSYYTFSAWYTTSALTTAVSLSSGKYTPSSTTTIYAKWTPVNYSISYNLNGGSVSGNPTSYNIESAAFTLKNPSRTGYTFTGWSGTGLSGSANTSVTVAKGSTGNRSYTANWSANSYYLDVNGLLGGVSKGSTEQCGTFDVYTGGTLRANDVNDYYASWVTGTTYSISDIKAKNGCTYAGVSSGSASGTITGSNVAVQLKYTFAAKNYGYTGGVQSFVVPISGTYKLQVWGAQGGTIGTRTGGLGGYAYGNKALTAGNTIYVVVGQQPPSSTAAGPAAYGGYNGGGNGNGDVQSSIVIGDYARGGGGATHIGGANTNTQLKSVGSSYRNGTYVYIVAGGGGGGGEINNGGAGGAATGATGGGAYGGTGGSQSAGGQDRGDKCAKSKGSFGQGGSACDLQALDITRYWAGGGGGGWYGGGGGDWSSANSSSSYSGGGGGGSNYVGGVTSSSTQQGQRSGSGYATISFVS